MQTAIQSEKNENSVSKPALWAGRIMSWIIILFLIFDSTIHLIKNAPVIDAFNQLGVPIELSVPISVIELFCLILYIIPRTSIFGAILLTGYLGGAIIIQLRVGAPMFSTALFPVYMVILLWGGIYLRDESLRSLIPIRRNVRSKQN